MKIYQVTGMNCAACSVRVEKAAASVRGAESVSVNLLTGDLRVAGEAAQEDVIAAIEAAGYGCSVKEAGDSGKKQDVGPETIYTRTREALKKRLLRSLLFLLPLSYTAMGIVMLDFPAPSFLRGNPLGIALTELLLSSAVLFLNRSFFSRGIRTLLHGAPTMDTLVSMGSGISWVWSVICMYQMTLRCTSGPTDQSAELSSMLHQLYFESAAMILVLITFGKLLEAKSKEKTTDALQSMKKLRPDTARIREGNISRVLPIEQLKAGDQIEVLPGEAIPADGIVLEGISAVDESMLTGESCLVDKCAQSEGKDARESQVQAATINKTGRLLIAVTAVGADTTLSRIIARVEESASTKAPVQRLADRISSVFVPAVLGIALITFTAWMLSGASLPEALERAVSVLVISCPCALGLATPVAIMVASGVGASHGILFKNAEVLEHCGRLQTAVFDKTGTLTKARAAVTHLICFPGVTEEALLKTAAGVEAASEHPIAEAVLAAAEKRGIQPDRSEEFYASGSSVSAKLCGKRVFAGSRKLTEELLKEPSDIGILEKELQESEAQGQTIIYFTEEDHLLGAIALEDEVRETSAQAVKELQELGVRSVLLSGDQTAAAQFVSQKAGIDTVYAGVLPGQKADIIEKLCTEGMTAMVGDGINDAIALKTADIGFAVAAGTDVAMDAADVVLMKTDLRDVAAAIRLSRMTMKTIRQNLFWAFFYNALCIPLAAGLYEKPFGISLSPMIGAACMGLSSLFVVTNALRLNLVDIYGGNRRPEEVRSNESKESSKDSSKDSNNDRNKTMSRTAERETFSHADPCCSCDSEEEKNMIEIKVDGMMCPHCEKRVKDALEALEGVTKAEASHERGLVTVEGTAARAALIEAILKAGYEVRE